MVNEDKIRALGSYSDEELIALIRNGSEKAFNALAVRYAKTVSYLARNFRSGSLTQEDWYQEGMIGFISAVRSFNGANGAAFSTYASVCISNRLRSVLRKNESRRNAPLNDYVIFDDSTLPPVASTEDEFIESESYRRFSEDFFSSLSKTESQVISCYIAGFTYSEIAEKLGISEKSVDNALCRVRAKLKKSLKSN